MIKCIHDRELRRSESIYILQEIPNHQLCTVLGTVRNNLSISRTQRTGNKVTWTQRCTPTWDPTPGLIFNVSFRLRPCLSLTPKHGYKSFPIQEPTNLPDLLDPMAVSNQVVSLDQRLKQWTVLNKLISTSRTTSLASAQNFKNKPFPWLKWDLD